MSMPTRPLRILVGTVEIAGVLPDYATGFRRLGHQVTTVVSLWNRFYPDFTYDADISPNAPDLVPWPSWVARSRSPLVRFPRGAVNRVTRWNRWLRLLASHDLFVFPWAGVSLTVGNREFPLLRALGKRIVSVFLGSDVRHPSAFAGEFADLPREPAFEAELRARTGDEPTGAMWNLRRAERYSDLILSQPNQSSLAVRPYMHLLVPIDLPSYRASVPGREIPVVVHAPSSSAVKGTAFILAALQRLREEGVSFDLRLLQGVPNSQVRAELTSADVAVDQLHLPLHGKFGLEAMASGCALATCNRQDHEPYPPDRPIWHVDPGNVYPSLKALLMGREMRLRLAREGRKYVERYHDATKIAQGILDSLQQGPALRFDHRPTYFARWFRLEPGVVLPASLRAMTTRVVGRWGLPDDVDPADLVARGLMLSPRRPVPRWAPDGLAPLAPQLRALCEEHR